MAHCNLCGEDTPVSDNMHADMEALFDHLRVMHPEVYGDGPGRWPDGGLVVEVEADSLTPDLFGGEA